MKEDMASALDITYILSKKAQANSFLPWISMCFIWKIVLEFSFKVYTFRFYCTYSLHYSISFKVMQKQECALSMRSITNFNHFSLFESNGAIVRPFRVFPVVRRNRILIGGKWLHHFVLYKYKFVIVEYYNKLKKV